MSTKAKVDPATERVLATVDDDELAARYPDRTHFIAANSPDQGQLATRALFAGDPVAIIYPDGREVLMRPEQVAGVAALFLFVAAFFLRRGRRKPQEDAQLPPRTHIEARDSRGHPIAA
jgi:hypothetical protein